MAMDLSSSPIQIAVVTASALLAAAIGVLASLRRGHWLTTLLFSSAFLSMAAFQAGTLGSCTAATLGNGDVMMTPSNPGMVETFNGTSVPMGWNTTATGSVRLTDVHFKNSRAAGRRLRAPWVSRPSPEAQGRGLLLW